MEAFYTEIAGGVLRVVCALIGVLLTAVVMPWLKTSALPWLKEKRLYSLVQKFVQAAEKLAETGVLERKDKKQYVVDLLEQNGYKVNAETEAFIESAVKELDMTMQTGWEEIIDVFEDEDKADTEEADG